jgi:hypothetical protein
MVHLGGRGRGAVFGLAYAATFNRPGIAVAAVKAPISILELTVKSGDLPMQRRRLPSQATATKATAAVRADLLMEAEAFGGPRSAVDSRSGWTAASAADSPGAKSKSTNGIYASLRRA